MHDSEIMTDVVPLGQSEVLNIKVQLAASWWSGNYVECHFICSPWIYYSFGRKKKTKVEDKEALQVTPSLKCS